MSKDSFCKKAVLCVFLLVMVNLHHYTEISVCRRYYFYVLPCIYQVIANGGKKNIGCVSLTLNYSFEIIVCEKRISLGSCTCRTIRLNFGYYNFFLWNIVRQTFTVQNFTFMKGKENTCTCFLEQKYFSYKY